MNGKLVTGKKKIEWEAIKDYKQKYTEEEKMCYFILFTKLFSYYNKNAVKMKNNKDLENWDVKL